MFNSVNNEDNVNYEPYDKYDNNEGFGLIAWLFLLFISLIIITFVACRVNMPTEAEMNKKIREKEIEILQHSPIGMYNVEPLTEEEMKLFRKMNHLPE